MPTRKTRPSANPRLRDIFAVFLRMGAMSFGGGMTSWTRREVVERRGWIDDRRFITGVGLSQISPGANGVNIAVYVGTVLHGGLGALVAVIGMLAAPVAVVLLAGGLYFGMNALPQGAWFGLALAGIGAGAIGLNLANGLRLVRRNVRRLGAIAVVVATAASLGFGVPLGWVLVAMIPSSLLVAWAERSQA